jgi:hypothetical protein
MEKGMTQAISHYSRFDDAEVDGTGERYRYKGIKQKSAELKVRRFYTVSILTLFILALALFFLTNFGGKHVVASPTSTVLAPASPNADQDAKDKGRANAH